VMTVALFKFLRARGSLLEANLSQTIGSASTSLASGTIFTIPALFLWGMAPPYLQVVALCFLGGVLGLSAMIPLRRMLIVEAKGELPYPEGTACAEVLRATAAGAGGHASTLSPFALIQEIRRWFDGPLALSGSIANGRAILAAQAMGADLAYMGSLFIATEEANAAEGYKRMITECSSADIVYSNLFTGVHGNYLAPSIVNAGMDPANLPESDPSKMNFGSGGNTDAKAWKDIWGCGQGIGVVDAVRPAREVIDQLAAEYVEAKQSLDARYIPQR